MMSGIRNQVNRIMVVNYDVLIDLIPLMIN